MSLAQLLRCLRCQFADRLVLLLSIFGTITVFVLNGAYNRVAIHRDEGYEAVKVRLLHSGFLPAVDFWNDQPPFLALIGSYMPADRPGVVQQLRLIALLASLVGLIGFHSFMVSAFDKKSADIGALYLAGSTTFLTFAHAAILETVGTGLAWGCVGCLSAAIRGSAGEANPVRRTKNILFCIVGGVLALSAISTKFTALLPLAAAYGANAGIHAKPATPTATEMISIRRLLWLNGLTALCVLLGATCMIETSNIVFETLLATFSSHFANTSLNFINSITRGVETLTASSGGDWLLLVIATIGVVFPNEARCASRATILKNSFAFWRSTRYLRYFILTISLILFVSAAAPCWDYYSVLIVFPLSAIAANTSVRVYQVLAAFSWRDLLQIRPLGSGEVGALLAASLIALSVILFAASGVARLGAMRSLATTQHDPMLQLLRRVVEANQTLFSTDPIYYDWMNKDAPPALAILPWKRLRSGDVTLEGIARSVIDREFDWVLLRDGGQVRWVTMRSHLEGSYKLYMGGDRWSLLRRN